MIKRTGNRGSTSNNKDFYQSTAWKKIREKALRRDKYECKLCKRYGISSNGNYVHHIIEVEDEWDKRLDLDNLVCICSKHHNQIHGEESYKLLR